MSKEQMPPPEHDKARHEREEKSDHSTNLYDVNESLTGETIDPATGEKINNSPATESADEEMEVVKNRKNRKTEDALGDMPDEEDEAAKWLRENGK